MWNNSQMCYNVQSQASPLLSASLWVTGPTGASHSTLPLQLTCRISLLNASLLPNRQTQPSQKFHTPGNESLSNNHSRSIIGLPTHKIFGYHSISNLDFFKLLASSTAGKSQLSGKEEGRKERNLITHRLHRTQMIHKVKQGDPECLFQFLHRKASNHQPLVCLSSGKGIRIIWHALGFQTRSIWSTL